MGETGRTTFESGDQASYAFGEGAHLQGTVLTVRLECSRESSNFEMPSLTQSNDLTFLFCLNRGLGGKRLFGR